MVPSSRCNGRGSVRFCSFTQLLLVTGPPGSFYYSYDLGDWHIIVLNDNTTGLPDDGVLGPVLCILNE